jgi:hypothetical protein
MWTLVAIPLTCWLCAIVALPRKPHRGNEVEDLVYTRLFGRQQHLILLALLASAVAIAVFVIRLPGRSPAEDSAMQPPPQIICNTPLTGLGVCWVERPGEMWAVERLQPDGTVVIEDYVSGPPPDGRSASP